MHDTYIQIHMNRSSSNFLEINHDEARIIVIGSPSEITHFKNLNSALNL